MTDISKIDQRYAEAQAALDDIVAQVRVVLDTKREQHGDKFDNARALHSLYPRLHKMPSRSKTVLITAALFRLAQTEDPFAEIADLDFEFDPEETP